jgi:GalNAc-alpha-(1->4)-GalNAc-alpha-(1->3)-diNAcBac-PP-undecaprenol alpha-1,4-N-acetyl-D-galactosaminyltransferase
MMDDRQGLLFIIGSLTPGGAERVVSILANSLASAGCPVGVLTIDAGEDAFPLDQGVDRIRAHTTIQGHSVRAAFKRYRLIRRAIHEEVIRYNPACVVSFLNTLNVRVIDALRHVRVPLFISERNTKESLQGLFWRFLRRILYPKATGLIVQTQRQACAFAGYNRFIRVIPNPLVLPSPRPAEEKEKIILLVGRMSPQKQFDRFLEEIRPLDLNGYRVVIAGEMREPMMSRIDAVLSRGDYPHTVDVIGHVADLGTLYDAAAVFVLVSRYEGFPNALSEALSWGCAAVSFDCPTGPAELITDGVNGRLVADQDWQALRLALQEVITDESMQVRFYQSALEKQKQYDARIVAQQWRALCQSESMNSYDGTSVRSG